MSKSVTDVSQRIQAFNQGRAPKQLKMKYQAMRTDIFSFYRGTCHLFYQDWPDNSELNTAPAAWISGDLHLENFGTFKGSNRLVYFDLNDFDEAALAPCTWEIARLLVSMLVGAQVLEVDETQAPVLCDVFLNSYIAEMSKGHVRALERSRATGMIKDLLTSLKQRSQKALLDDHTEKHNGKRKLCIDNKHALPASKKDRAKVSDMIDSWAKTPPNPEFFKLLDVAQRIAGIGSLGLERYMLLVEGEGSPDDNVLLDLKQAVGSSLQPYLTLKQPHWHSQAQRVIAVQERVQAMPPALLTAFDVDGTSYRMRELQPGEDRIRLNGWNGRWHRLEKLIVALGQLVAWDQLRAGGRQGSATADDFIAFATNAQWRKPVLDYAKTYHKQVAENYSAFCTAFDGGQLKV